MVIPPTDVAEPAWDWAGEVPIPSPFNTGKLVLFTFYYIASMAVYCKHILSIIAYCQQCLFSLLSDIKEEIKGAVKEAMASTTEAISQAVGSAILTNMKIVIKQLL